MTRISPYTKEERLAIGKQIYEGELTKGEAASVYGISYGTAKNYQWMYRDKHGLPPRNIKSSKTRSEALQSIGAAEERAKKAERELERVKAKKLLNTDEMKTALVELKASRKTPNVSYEVISAEIGAAVEALHQSIIQGRVNLNDTDLVIVRTEEYFSSCSAAGIFPSVMGLSVYGYGLSNGTLSTWLKNHPSHPTSEYINMIKDAMADILTNASLNNSANVIQAIFQLKNHFGHEDHVKVEAFASQDLLQGARSKEEIAMRYKENVVIDD